MEESIGCPCGMPKENGKCIRKHPVKACKREVKERIGRHPGFSKWRAAEGLYFDLKVRRIRWLFIKNVIIVKKLDIK